MDIKENLKKIKDEIPPHVKLVAVSKTKPNEDILEAYRAGQRVFGENKAQELIGKQPDLPEDIQWHFIGHLQRNKVKFLVPFVTMIESVDSFRLLRQINKEAMKVERRIDCLLQFHIASEETKFGLDITEAKDILGSEEFTKFEGVRICGVMGMATFTSDMEKVRSEFKTLKAIFDQLKASYFADNEDFKYISGGMSNDYRVAIEESCNIIRIGSEIFGERNK